MTYDLVLKIKRELNANGFKLVHAQQGNDSTTILSYGKDGFEVTLVIPGKEFTKHADYSGMD